MSIVNHAEERVNAATHAVGLAAGATGAAVVVAEAARHGGPWEVAGCLVYGVTLVAMYAASTLSHAFTRPRPRAFFRAADQAVIFLFIAGSYTPVAVTWLRGAAWWPLHAGVWGVALAGFLSKAVFSHRTSLGSVTTWLYVLLGWAPLIAGWGIVAVAPGGLVGWFVAGGLLYTAGLAFFRYDDRIPFFHAAWHVMVMGGSFCQYLAILRYCAVVTR